MNFTLGKYQYLKDEFGVHQLNPDPYIYDENYCATYDTEAYRKGNENLQRLRFNFIVNSYGKTPFSICDVGYGNGAFLSYCNGKIPVLYGKDVSGVKLDFADIVYEYPLCDVMTFHDVLEHIPDLSFLRDLKCDVIVISCPCCHFDSIEWFDTWKHRKPNEHLHHWNEVTLTNLMNKYGWLPAAEASYHEDYVRIPLNGQRNILTMAFKR